MSAGITGINTHPGKTTKKTMKANTTTVMVTVFRICFMLPAYTTVIVARSLQLLPK